MSNKQNIYNFLAQSDDFVSGQEIAESIGISRAAVWKTVNLLIAEGCVIDAVRNRGYRLLQSDGRLYEHEIRRHLPRDLAGCPIIIYSEIDSTNSQAKRLAAGQLSKSGAANFNATAKSAADIYPPVTLLLSESQNSGRGRFGRRFFSPPGAGLYMSVLIRPGHSHKTAYAEDSPRDFGYLTIAAAVAATQTISELYGLNPGIKWVNDIYIDGKKLAGILTETQFCLENNRAEFAIVGIGINTDTTREQFPAELRETATSLAICRAADVNNNDFTKFANHDAAIDRNILAAKLFANIIKVARESETDSDSRKSILNEYRSRSILIGHEITYESGGEKRVGFALDLNPDGNLVIRDGEEIKTLCSGEVSLTRRIN